MLNTVSAADEVSGFALKVAQCVLCVNGIGTERPACAPVFGAEGVNPFGLKAHMPSPPTGWPLAV